MLLPSVDSASPAPGGAERPRPCRLTKSAIVVVKDSESDIEDPIVKQESKVSVSRGHVPARDRKSVVEGEVAVSEQEKKRRKKEERCAEIMVDFKADKITGDDAGK